jgi:hypothetical protein
MIECIESTPVVMPTDLKQTAFAAWERARRDIHEAWTFETDPANLQPRVSKFNRGLAAFLRKYVPTSMDQRRMERCLDAVEAPCSRREENLLRAVADAEYPTPEAKARAIVEEVERIGLEPFHAPSPLPPIEQEQIRSSVFNRPTS